VAGALKMKVKVIDNTAKALRQMEQATEREFRLYTDDIVETAQTPWPPGAPFKFGNLRDSIAILGELLKGTLRVVTRTGYGAYVELGTAFMAARPFLLNSIQKASENFLKRGKWK